jgi:hypothetical protein
MGWDGNYKQKKLEAGNYIWQISLTDLEGNTETGQGTVLLIR